MEGGGVQVGESEYEEIVLHGVQTGGDSQAEGLPRSVDHLLGEGCEGGGEGALGEEEEEQAESVLETFCEEDHRGGSVGLSVVVSPGVPQEDDGEGGLEDEHYQHHGSEVLGECRVRRCHGEGCWSTESHNTCQHLSLRIIINTYYQHNHTNIWYFTWRDPGNLHNWPDLH